MTSPGAAFARLPTPVRAAALTIAALSCFTAMGALIKLAAQDVHPLEVVFFRNALGVLILCAPLIRQRAGFFRGKPIRLYALRAVLGAVAMSAFFVALTLIPLAEATALGFTSPLFATAGAALLLGERIRAHRISALAVGFLGVLIVLQPGLQPTSLGAWLMLTNAALLGLIMLLIKRLSATESAEEIALWMVLLQTPLALIPALFVWTWPSAETWALLFAIAAAGSLGHVLWTRAFAIAEVTQLQPLEFVKLPMMAALGYLLFSETPGLWVWIGGAAIFASTAYITHREARLARRLRAHRPDGAH